MDVNERFGRISTRQALVVCFRMLVVWLLSHNLLLSCAYAESNDMRLRVTISHPTGQAWNGRLQASTGSLATLKRLDDSREAAPPMLVDASTAAFRREASEPDVSFDVNVVDDMSGALHVQLGAADGQPVAVNIPLIDLITGRFEQTVPGSSFEVTVERVPGDALRVLYARKHLIFTPGEKWTVDAVPHLVSGEVVPEAKLELKLFEARSRRVVWRQSEEIESDASGQMLPAQRLEIPIPEEEGAYDLVLTLSRDGLRNLLKTGPPLVERTLQFAVVANQSVAGSSEPGWREVLEFDTSEPQWWERLARFPAWQDMPGSLRQLFGENFGQPFFRSDRRLNQIEGDGWLAIPLPVLNQGTAHQLEIEYPEEVEQTMAVTIVERDPSGDQLSPSVQSGFHVMPTSTGMEGSTQSIIFWPRTRLSYLVLSNKNADQPVGFGRVRVSESTGHSATMRNSKGRRRSLAHFIDPQLTRAFGGTMAVDPVSNQSLTDWATFLETGRHLVEYLQRAGLSGAAINVMSRDGQLTSHPLVDLGTQVDTGLWFSSGQDSESKDVLECYFRLFDREQLQLVPTIRLDMIVSTLETTAAASPGVWLVDAEGRLFSEYAQRRLPRYNVLDPRVQQVIQQVVDGIAQRYAHHDSFGGLAIELDESSFGCLPGPNWGYDSTTVARFLQTDAAKRMKVEPGAPGSMSAPTALAAPTQISSPQQLIDGPLSESWQAFRVAEVSRLYGQLAHSLTQQRADTKLFLMPAGLLDTETARRSITNNGTSRDRTDQQLMNMALDLERLSAIRGLVAVRPLMSAAGGSLVASRPQIEISSQPVSAQFFDSSAAQVTQFPIEVLLPELQGGRRKTMPIVPNRIRSEVQPTAAMQLQTLSRAVVDSDVKTVFLTQREPTSNLATLSDWSLFFRGLPSQNFDDVPIDEAASASPLCVRTYSRGDESYVYVVNRSPWPVSTSVGIRLPPHARLDHLHTREEESIRADGDHWVWNSVIKPYDMRVVTTSARTLEVLSVQHRLPEDVRSNLQSAISALAHRVTSLGEPRGYDQVTNARFDQPPEQEKIPGWQLVSSNEGRATLDSAAARSGAALRIDGRAEMVTVRSDPFPAPTTGRLSLHVWLRSQANVSQPSQPPARLRLAIEGELYNRPYHRFATVELNGPQSNEPASDSFSDWAPYVLHIDDLPDDGLSDLRVRFDLIGGGSVWLDDVEIYDLSFTQAEQRETSKIIALADLQLREGRLTDCWQTLDRFWPRYILKYVIEDQSNVAGLPTLLSPVGQPQARKRSVPNSPPAASPGPLRRMRDLIPQMPWRNRK